MGKVISVHDYELNSGTDSAEFEQVLRTAEEKGLFQLPGLAEHHFLRGIKGARAGKFTAIWVYESRNAWEALWGTPNEPKEPADYPDRWQEWEMILAPFLEKDPNEIFFTAYEEISFR